MLLRNVSVIGEEDAKDIFTKDETIQSIKPFNGTVNTDNKASSLLFDDAIAFPGLINSHDHLDFNLFPSLNNKLYNSYREWGKDIHENNKKEIDKTLQIPKSLRIEWGIYKNLLNGFTTVVNHGEQLKIKSDIINVFQNTHALHSVGFEKRWKWKLNNPFKKSWPIAAHVGEGKDEVSHKEINQLIKWNFFKKKIVGIHGVAMDTKQAKHFHALVWCPASNYFLLNRTTAIDFLKDKTNIIFGSDSTLTSSWNIWEHIRLARNEKMLNDKELFEALTTKAAAVWGLYNIGKIEKEKQADLVIARKKKNQTDYNAFYAINPKDILLVMYKGNIRLFDNELKNQVTGSSLLSNNFSKIKVGESVKHVQGNFHVLINEIKRYYPETELPILAL